MATTIRTSNTRNLGTISWEVTGLSETSLTTLSSQARFEFEQAASDRLTAVAAILATALMDPAAGAKLLEELKAALLPIASKASRIQSQPRH